MDINLKEQNFRRNKITTIRKSSRFVRVIITKVKRGKNIQYSVSIPFVITGRNKKNYDEE